MSDITVTTGDLTDDEATKFRMIRFADENEWTQSLNAYIAEKDGGVDVLRPWLTDELDLPNNADHTNDDRLFGDDDHAALNKAGRVKYDTERREWIVDINDHAMPSTEGGE